MKRPRDLARRFLKVADRDVRTVRLLAAARDSDDEAVGFHAQQSIEKCLKAVLAVGEIPFRRTHDLAELIDLLRDNNRSLPPDIESLESLNPYAVTLRYDLFDMEPSPLDRDKVVKIVTDIRSWAEREVEAAAEKGQSGRENSGNEVPPQSGEST